ncbi:MAG: Carbohydrate diacid regulator [Candidatus Izimaplasma bacterium HR2]|nr:MAG: Carbohydrate diacid regulator [Candidatus Izimaplasma bacterium HR2]
MKISAKQATAIIDSLKDVIEHDINFINLKSIIIASSDKSRIGEFHEGSQKVIESRETMIIESDDEYRGTKAGINLPVLFDDDIVAVIGITGKYQEVKKFSDVIRKLTEILIKEFYYRDQIEIRRENERYLVELMINNLESSESIRNIANSLDITLEQLDRLVIIKLQEKEHKYENMRNLIFNSIRKRLDKSELIVNSHGDYVLLLGDTDVKKLNKIKEYITSKYSIGLSVGMSESMNDVSEIYYQYLNTNRIVQIAHKTERFEIVKLGDFDLELILLNIDDSIKATYLKKVFQDIDKDTLIRWTEMLMVFSRNNGSINATSEELYVHKNTLQYRLKKVKEITGYDPRKLRDFTILYLAILLYKQ